MEEGSAGPVQPGQGGVREAAGAGVRCWVGDAEWARFREEGALHELAWSRRSQGPEGLHACP